MNYSMHPMDFVHIFIHSKKVKEILGDCGCVGCEWVGVGLETGRKHFSGWSTNQTVEV